MKKGIILGVGGLWAIVFLIASVSAGIYFSQPEQSYNLGDRIVSDITLDSGEEGFLRVDLVCEDAAVNVFNGIPVDSKAHIEFPLTMAYIQNISGECYFSARYGGSTQQSRGFVVSKILNVRLNVDSLFAKPGEEVIISGIANRLNGIGVSGGVEINIPLLGSGELTETTSESEINGSESNETEAEEEVVKSSGIGKFFGKIVNGSFSVPITLAKEVPAGDYRVDVLAYEEYSGSRTSEGVSVANLRVSQVLTKVEVTLGLQNLDPGQELNFKPRLLDQSGQTMGDELSVIIRDGNSKRVFEKIIVSDETVIYKVPTNLSAGYYEIEASSSGFSDVKTFYVNEKKIVSLELINNTLFVTNIGNVILEDYPIEIELNGKPFVKKVTLGLGQKQEFKLTGDGTYDIKIKGGDEEITRSGVVLTGNAVGVQDIKEAGIVALNSPIVWIFLIIILAGIALFFFRDVFKKKSFAYPFKNVFNRNKNVVELKAVGQAGKTQMEVAKDGKVSAVKPVSEAEKVLVLDGQKNRATIVVLKIKNKIEDFAKKSLERSIENVYEKKAAVYERGEEVFIIFSPLMTKTFKNELEAAKAAEKIVFILNDHNSKFKEKIDFGIGINSGDVINKIEDRKLKFTALGNLVILARKLADASDKQIFMAKDSYEKAMNEIKAVKTKTKDGEDVYEVQRVLDREQSKEFINKFLTRQKEDNKKNQNQKYSGQGI